MGNYKINYDKSIKVLDMLGQGITQVKICKDMKISKASVQKIKKGGIEGAEKLRAEEKKREEDRKKLDFDIVTYLKNGLSQKVVANKVNCTQPYVSYISRKYNVPNRAFGNTVTANQLRIWAYIYKRYGTNKEKE